MRPGVRSLYDEFKVWRYDCMSWILMAGGSFADEDTHPFAAKARSR